MTISEKTTFVTLSGKRARVERVQGVWAMVAIRVSPRRVVRQLMRVDTIEALIAKGSEPAPDAQPRAATPVVGTIYEVPVYDGASKEWRVLNLSSGTVYSTTYESEYAALDAILSEPTRGEHRIVPVLMNLVDTLVRAASTEALITT